MTIPCDPPSAPQAAGTMKKKLIPALLGGAVGLFLLLGGSRLIPGISDGSGQATEMPARAPGEAYEVSLDAYRQALESRIASICAQVAGAGDVRVIVSLAGGYEYVYATDEKSAASGTSRLYVTIGSGSGRHLPYGASELSAPAGEIPASGGRSHPCSARSLASGATASLSRQRDSGAERKIGAYSAPDAHTVLCNQI